ncbi:MAG: hypothetical protein ACRDMZ_20680, partial [Solirubrobacteraceae bacterium]
RGLINVGPDWQSLAPSPGAEFVAHDESAGVRRDFVVTRESLRTLSVDGKTIAQTPAADAWIAAMVQEFVRRTGTSATTRASQIVERDDVAGLLAEAKQIAIPNVRVRYLHAGFAHVDSAGRASFIRDGASLLGPGYERADFLLALPPTWRTDLDALAAVYREAAALDASDAIEHVLRVAPPPRPLPFALRSAVETLIARLASTDRRAALRAYYFDARP